MGRFPPVPPEPDFPAQELRVLDLWEQTDAFRRSVEQRDRKRSFVFYDGPPFATGVPHYGHLVPSTIKAGSPNSASNTHSFWRVPSEYVSTN